MTYPLWATDRWIYNINTCTDCGGVEAMLVDMLHRGSLQNEPRDAYIHTHDGAGDNETKPLKVIP